MPDPRTLIALPLAFALAGCVPKPMEATTAPAPLPTDPPSVLTQAGSGTSEPTGACDAAKAYPLIGEMRSEALGSRAGAATGARSVRWTTPGTVVTMDHREDRLNIDLDGQGRVVGFRCG